MEKDPKALFFLGLVLLSCLFLLLTGPLIVFRNVALLMVQIFGLLFICWAFLAQKVNKKRTNGLPPGYFYLNKGPYEIIRHPVYAGLILIMFSLLEYNFEPLRVLAFGLLVAGLFMKMLREEYALEQKIEEYKEYKAKTRYLIPYLF